MAVKHKDLPDSELHEAKGFASASNDRVLKKKGGVSQWAQVETNDIATGSVTNSKLSTNAVTAVKVATDAIQSRHLKVKTVTATSLGSSNTGVPVSGTIPLAVYPDKDTGATAAVLEEKGGTWWVGVSGTNPATATFVYMD